MKKTFRYLSIALAGVLAGGLLSACGEQEKEKKATGYVSVDVNPSVSFVLDEDQKVLSVIAENEDAQVLLYEETFEGLTVEKALEKLADLAVELGYLHEGNRGVNVTAQGDVQLNELQNSVSSAFQAAVTEDGGEYSVNITSDGLFSVQREVSEINATYHLELTVGEYELIAQAQAADKTLTVQAAAEMTQEELLAIVYAGVDEALPYATEAYIQIKNEAFGVYYKAKEELLNSFWSLPYLNVFKYPSMNGLVYGTYSAASIVLETGLRAAELACKVAEKTEIPATVTDAIATALGMTETEEKAAFDKAIQGEDGKVTLASLEGYLNTYFKNMTADEREAAKAVFDQVMTAAKQAAATVYEAIDQEYKDALQAMLEEMEKAIPEQLKTVAQGVIAEYKATVEEMRAAIEGKEPMAAAYATLEELQEAKAELLEKMKKELEEGGDLQAVQERIDGAKSSFESFENLMNTKIQKAEEDAKAYLLQLKLSKTI